MRNNTVVTNEDMLFGESEFMLTKIDTKASKACDY